MTKLQSVASVCITGALLAAAGTFAQSHQATAPTAQPPSHDHEHASGNAAAAAPKQQVPPTDAVDAEQATTMELEAIEAELDLLVTKMNVSEGPSKIAAMEELLAKLVSQHRGACGSMMRSRTETAPGGCCDEMKKSHRSESDGHTSPADEPTP